MMQVTLQISEEKGTSRVFFLISKKKTCIEPLSCVQNWANTVKTKAQGLTFLLNIKFD